ncbi:MAG: flagellar protein FliS [bacterium]|nr:flagellar protein FliS [bacterium]
MYGNQGVRRYRETDLGTMTRERMVVLLYEKSISDLEEALRCLETGDRSGFTKKVNHSQRIVAELRGALDHATGGDIARNLEAIYDFIFREHLSLLVDRDARRARSCIDVLTPLLEAWRQIPNGTAEAAARDRARGPAGADPATVPKAGEAPAAAAPRPATPEAPGVRPNLLSVSA